MAKYELSFMGREKGAIGAFYRVRFHVEPPTRAALLLAAEAVQERTHAVGWCPTTTTMVVLLLVSFGTVMRLLIGGVIVGSCLSECSQAGHDGGYQDGPTCTHVEVR